MISSSIPQASPTDKAFIETLVQKCLDTQGQNVAAYEAEIEAIVARLYGLTEAEGAIVKDKKDKS